jgi:hypothetical protein
VLSFHRKQTPNKTAINYKFGRIPGFEQKVKDLNENLTKGSISSQWGVAGSYGFHLFVFADHLAMIRDPVFTDNLLYYLLDPPH